MAEIVPMNALARKNFLMPTTKLDDQKFEFLFVLDRSGSMYGYNRIVLAKRALALFIRSLPVSCYFNIIGYGTHFKLLFPKSVPYNQENVNTAINYAETVQADLLENNLLSVMKHIYSSPQIPGYLQQVFVLTDGGEPESDVEIIINLVNERKSWARVFSLGAGELQCRPLVEKIAVAGGGTAEFAPDNDRIESKILTQLRVALKPSLLKPIRV